MGLQYILYCNQQLRTRLGAGNEPPRLQGLTVEPYVLGWRSVFPGIVEGTNAQRCLLESQLDAAELIQRGQWMRVDLHLGVEATERLAGIKRRQPVASTIDTRVAPTTA